MNEPTKRGDLSPEQQNTATLMRQMLGKSIADRYVDFCRVASGAIPLRVSVPVAGHAIRELDSVLRQTLAGPIGVALEATTEDKARLKAARKQLRALGFKDDAVNRAVEKLRPRRSHKEEIQAIVTRLGLGADGDIARAWISIAQAHGEAHRRDFYRSLVVDEEFRLEWQQPFDTVVRGLMIALQGKYAAFMQRVDQLVAMADRAAAVKIFVKEIPGALPLLWHFFNQLQTADWLPHLAAENLLVGPTLPADDDAGDGLLLRQWPAGRYLVRMAGSEDPEVRSQVVQALRGVGTSQHVDVQQLGIEVLAALPADDAAPLVDLAETWLTRNARFVMAQAPHDLLRRLAQAGHGAAALRVARVLFQVFDNGGRLATLFSQHMYEHFLPDTVKALAPACGVEAVGLLCSLLDRAVRISGKFSEDPPSDYTYYLSGQISEHGVKHDVIDALVGGIIQAAKLAIKTAPSCTQQVMLEITSHPAKIFVRLALHVLSFYPGHAPELAEGYLTKTDLIEASWCSTEYAALAQAWFPSLPPAMQQRVLACVDSVPDKYIGGWKQRFEAHSKRPVTAKDERLFRLSAVRDILWGWRSVLPEDRQAQVTAAVKELGDPDAWRRGFDEPEAPPPEAPDFQAAPIDKIIAFLQAWRPSPEEKRQTMTALAQGLRLAAGENPELYSANAPRFAGLPLLYVRRVLEGLENASNNRKSLDWDGAVSLVASVIQSTEHVPSGIEGDDADTSWCLKAGAALLASGLRQGARGIPFKHAELVTRLVSAFYRQAPRLSESTSFEESYRSSPFFAAQGTARGMTVELVVLVLFWLSKDDSSPIGQAPRAALERLPALRTILEAELADDTPTGRIPRAVVGRYLNWLFFFDEAWFRRHITEILPASDLSLRDAGWISHLANDSGPIKDLAADMRDCYVAEINRLSADDGPDDRTHVEERLAHYLVVLYIWSALPDEVFQLFWDTAPASARKSAMWFLGTQLGQPPDQFPEPFRARAYSYWDRRLAAAKASSNPDYFREEIGTIGQFFLNGKIDGPWLMNQVLAMAAIGFAPSEPYSVLRHLAKLSAEHRIHAVEVLAALAKSPRFDRWVYMTQQAEVRLILANGIASGSGRGRSLAAETISYMAALGDGGYLDLLPKPE
ncbi:MULTISPECIES: hypothetical protein [Bradyrhizobium]|jgi:hypothetical protein|uniref:DUF4020 domain-containing protein n=2 Tax=Bradyrhizobium elkanii TaxID=29448 RepID=A0A4Q4K8U9_BRAEL|nr:MULTISPECIES: hypothetical protein [Bradyrhizobium]MBP1290614.1 hypothetical protein [Bradyrhizobium elkanii]MCP1755415.1 hypothetical protein [Bradyrhizobium elkanii]MCP1929076.1 hypothetical protein [Bradyrhizobium elkanii]MCP1980932.1 hypothetical protein [Bradyrhizobium elkanii]MCS3452640.1 hypothetical protein [Bradyrhizobium elkanii]